MLSPKDLETLVNLCDAEVIRRKLAIIPPTSLSGIVIRERPTVRQIGDPDGDVLWKHHGVTESEAHEQMYDEH